MAIDNAFPTAATALTTMAQWEALYVGGMGGASGVIAGKASELAPSINSGARTVSLAAGSALVRGFYVNNAAATATAVPTASAGDRVDRLVLRLDRTAVTAPNWVKPVIIQGTSGSSTPPAIQATDNASWDEPMFRWTTKADGTLTGLVDERRLIGGQFSTFRSTTRPAASPPRMGRETDTARLLVADGSQWAPVIADTGFVNITVTGNWKAGGLLPQIRCVGSVVYLRGSIERTVNTLQSTDTNSPFASIGSPFRPVGNHTWSHLTSAASPTRLNVSPAGALAVVDLAADVPVGRQVYIDTTWLIGS